MPLQDFSLFIIGAYSLIHRTLLVLKQAGAPVSLIVRQMYANGQAQSRTVTKEPIAPSFIRVVAGAGFEPAK